MTPCLSASRRIPFRGSGKVDSRFRGNDEVVDSRPRFREDMLSRE